MSAVLRQIIRANVRCLLGLKKGESGVSRLMKFGISNGNAQLILSGETNIGIDLLEELARNLKVKPWQLCVPTIGPDVPPSLDIFSVSREALGLAAKYNAMPAQDRSRLLQLMEIMITSRQEPQGGAGKHKNATPAPKRKLSVPPIERRVKPGADRKNLPPNLPPIERRSKP